MLLYYILHCSLPTVIALYVFHKYYYLPKNFQIISGSIESYHDKELLMNQRGEKFGVKLKNVTFRLQNGERIAFSTVIYKLGLWQQLQQYSSSALTGSFCTMKKGSSLYFFAYASTQVKIALSKDLYFPKHKIKNTLHSIKYLIAFYMLITGLGALFFIFNDPGEFVVLMIVFSFPISFIYFLYFHLFSNIYKKLYSQQIALLQELDIPIPII